MIKSLKRIGGLLRRRPRYQELNREVLSCESLEPRTMLAGDVHVSIFRGDLQIRGDAADNTVHIAPAEGGGIAISGRDGTLINGRPETLVVYEGKDRVPDDLHLQFSRGSNQIDVSDIEVGDDIYAHSGHGNDQFEMSDVVVNDRIYIRPGSGNDRVLIDGSDIGGPTARDVYIYATGGNNAVGVNNVEIRNDLYVRADRGDDVISAQNVRTGDDLRFYGSTGDDTLAILDSVIADDTTLEAGSRYNFWRNGGDDVDAALILNSVHNDRANIYLGPGNDFIGVRNVEIADRLQLQAGSGNDEVGIRQSSFNDYATVDGDSGSDGLLAEDNSFRRDPVTRSFGRGVENFDAKVDAVLADLAEAGVLGEQLDSITELVVGNDDFSTLEAAVVAAGLAETLDRDGPFTVFAPTNAAFEALPDGTLDVLLADPQGQLKDILLYHAVGEEILADEIVELTTVETLLGSRVTVDVTPQGVILNGSVNVRATDIRASNGVVHVIDAVLIPPGSITDIVVADEDFSTLETAVIAAGLAQTLDEEGDFTVFAPTNDAFDALPMGTLDALLSAPGGQLKDILLYHVTSGEAFANDVVQLPRVPTLLDIPVTVEVTPTGVVLNGTVNVKTTDIIASNGVIHVIDAVLIPPGSIKDIVVESDKFSTLESAVIAAGLADTLDGEGDFTVFAPTNAAFEALPDGTLDTLLADPTGQLKEILLYHVAGDELYSEDVVKTKSIETLPGPPISVDVTNEGVVLNGSVLVTETDIVASNGVIHVIDAVLIPPEGPAKTIAEIVSENSDFETLLAALEATDLTETFASEGSFTVFAPTDDAFDKLPRHLLTVLTRFAPDVLKSILLYHVVDTPLSSQELIQKDSVSTLLGRDVSVEVKGNSVFLNDRVQVTVTDIQATNGVIHVIDTVLMPARLRR